MTPPSEQAARSQDAEHDGKPVREDPTFVLRMGNRAASFVVICSISFVLGMLLILYLQLDRIETSARVTPVDAAMNALVADPLPEDSKITLLGQLIMESDAQFLRTERAQSLVGARLTVMLIAELIGLSLVVLGGAFIFARVRGEGSVDFTKGSEIVTKIISEFPGVLLCGFGTLLIIWALDTSVDDNSRTTTTDAPLFFPSLYESRPIQTDRSDQAEVALEAIDLICRREAPNPAYCD